METQLVHKARELFETLEQTAGNLKDFHETLEDIVHIAQKVFQADACAIVAMNPITKRFITSQAIAGDLPKSNFEAFEPALPEWLVQKFLEQSVFVVEDLALMPELHNTFTRLEGVRSLAALALRMRYHQRVPGALYLYFKQQQPFHSEELELFHFFASQASLILQETWLRWRHQIVAHIGQDINHELATIDILFQKLLKQVVDILDMSCFVLTIYQPQTNTLDMYMQENGDFTHLNSVPLQGVYKYVLETKKTLFIRHMSNETDLQAFQLTDTPGIGSHESFIFVPLVLGDESTGVVSIQHIQPNAYNQDDGLILQLLAKHIALARHNIRLYNRLNLLNETEQLLTQPLDAEQTLQAIVDKIQEATRANIFDASQKLFIEDLAHHAAFAIKYSQVFGTLSQRREHELETLQNIDRQLSRALDLESVLNIILRLAHKQVPSEEASILLYNAHKKALEVPAAIGPHAEARQNLTLPLQETRGITLWVLEHKMSARVDNVHNDPRWRDLYMRSIVDTTSELDVPLLDGEEVVGVLNFESTREGAFREEDEDFLLTLAGQVVLAIKNAQAYEREKRLAEEGRVLNQISKEITSHLNYKHVFDLILEKALELTNSSLGALFLYDPDLNDLRIVADRGLAEDKRSIRLGLHQGIVGYVARNKQLVNVDVSQAPWNEIYKEFALETRFELAAPLLAGTDLRGVINVESSYSTRFSESDERLLQGLADLAVVTLQNAERYAQARKEANRFELWYQAAQELGKITELTELEQAYDVVLRIAGKHSQCQVAIYRYDDTNEELVVTRKLLDKDTPPLSNRKSNEGIAGLVARERRTIVIHDTRNPPPDILPAHLSNLAVRSLLAIPIMFKERYYGNLELSHNDIDCFREADSTFFEGLVQQLATTIYRLETAQERHEFEHQAQSAAIMSSIGQVSFELTHRWGNSLGLVESYVDDIRLALASYPTTNAVIAKKLDNIVRVTRRVLDLSRNLKHELGKSGEAAPIPPQVLLEEAREQALLTLPSTVYIELEIDDEVSHLLAVYEMVSDILSNLVTNAIEAMPNGGKITLKAHNVGRFVALEVMDTGIGIPPAQQAKIFELSFSTKGSSGFGLWSARTNALKNNGDLRVKSQVGQGTTFTLLLPKIEKGAS